MIELRTLKAIQADVRSMSKEQMADLQTWDTLLELAYLSGQRKGISQTNEVFKKSIDGIKF